MDRIDIGKRRSLAALAAVAMGSTLAGPSPAATRPDLERAADATLARLVKSRPETERMLREAKGAMVFPEIIKGGLLVGGATGEGVLRIGGKTAGRYRSAAVSYGLQFGFATFGYGMLMMDRGSLDYVRRSDGWEVGVGPHVTVVDKSFARKLSTTSAQSGIYVFFLNQQGFFGGTGIEGAKISRISD